MELRIQCLCIDATDPARIASFWEAALGWRRTWEEQDQVCLEPPEGSPEDGIAPDLIFLKVPEGKTVKNRLHLDLRPADQDAEVARLQALGARQVSIGQGDSSYITGTDIVVDGEIHEALPVNPEVHGRTSAPAGRPGEAAAATFPITTPRVSLPERQHYTSR